ncbi:MULTISPECIES: ferredoxin [unclassified Halanaerobium]|uniref:(2Fe-2S) ferredoxin domain-containing protein n=1 Tax=unclassified Halanaerobium TaxID=2641197 RepID=UPI000E13556F|nr:NADP-reducing hydrogenase subunit HndB [Halanaerobium sp. MA284_MarDTE_T2]RCW80746.1 NADP-reducing hydrogenase subunit HndB [Halanaerobium sp. DL-01]
MKSFSELKEYQNEISEKKKNNQKIDDKPEIIIGMGTCGIAAGAKKIRNAVVDVVKEKNLDVKITETGCIGMCEKEPLMDIKMPGMERVTYGEIEESDVKRIINKHVFEKKIVKEFAIARILE